MQVTKSLLHLLLPFAIYCTLALGQPTQLQVTAPVPPAPVGGGQVNGAIGGQTVYYWVVAHYPGGVVQSAPILVANTIGVANFNAANYVTLTWNNPSRSITSFDVVRNTVSQVFPATCTTCAVVAGTAAMTANDTGGGSSYTQAAAAPSALASIFLDNITQATPQLDVNINGVQSTFLLSGQGGPGTVTSVGVIGTANQISVGGASPITGAGTFTLSLPSTLVLPGTLTAPSTVTLSGISAGTQVSCLGLDVSNHVVLNAAACGSGGGSGTVNSATQYDMTYYAATGTAVSGSSLVQTNNTLFGVGVAPGSFTSQVSLTEFVDATAPLPPVSGTASSCQFLFGSPNLNMRENVTRRFNGCEFLMEVPTGGSAVGSTAGLSSYVRTASTGAIGVFTQTAPSANASGGNAILLFPLNTVLTSNSGGIGGGGTEYTLGALSAVEFDNSINSATTGTVIGGWFVSNSTTVQPTGYEAAACDMHANNTSIGLLSWRQCFVAVDGGSDNTSGGLATNSGTGLYIGSTAHTAATDAGTVTMAGATASFTLNTGTLQYGFPGKFYYVAGSGCVAGAAVGSNVCKLNTIVDATHGTWTETVTPILSAVAFNMVGNSQFAQFAAMPTGGTEIFATEQFTVGGTFVYNPPTSYSWELGGTAVMSLSTAADPILQLGSASLQGIFRLETGGGFFNGFIGNAAATASNNIAGFASVPTTGTLPKCSVTSTTCTLTPTSVVDNTVTVTTSEPFFTSAAGAASQAALYVTGAPFTGGSGTTTYPLVYINDGTGPTSFSTAGTELGVNAPSGFTGNMLDFHVNGGASVAKLDYQGNLSVVSAATTSDGTHPSDVSFIGNTTAPTLASNTFYLIGPNTATFTNYGLQFSATGPSASSLVVAGAPSSGVSQVTFTTLGTNVLAFLGTPSGTNFNSMIAAGGIPIAQNSQSTAYVTVLADGGGEILHPTADNNPRTFTIAANASVAYAVGTVITFVNQINTLTIAINSDTLQLAGTGTTGSRTLAAGGIATATKIATTLWYISGPGLT